MNPELEDGNDTQPVRKWNPVQVWKVAQEPVMNGVRAWQLWERQMPPAQCRVNCFLKCSREGQVVLLPLVSLQSSVSSSAGFHFTSQDYFCFFFLGGGGGERKGLEKSLALKADVLSLNLGPLSNELSVTVRKILLFFCKQFLIWKMRNELKMFSTFSSNINFP